VFVFSPLFFSLQNHLSVNQFTQPIKNIINLTDVECLHLNSRSHDKTNTVSSS